MKIETQQVFISNDGVRYLTCEECADHDLRIAIAGRIKYSPHYYYEEMHMNATELTNFVVDMLIPIYEQRK